MSDSFTKLHYHLIFATKYRLPLIQPGIRSELERFLAASVAKMGGHAIEIGGMPDHTHILAGLPPTISIADALKRLKGSSSHWLSRRPDIDFFAWQLGYGAFTVSASMIDRVRRYIQNQEKHHAKYSLTEEIQLLRERHGLNAFDDDEGEAS